ncbi:hypothetical protein SAMD00023353_4100350 [Rosellinia necatrix]|uniref:Uncharacterized protein n=1 Tax=Rosellinia necatrix TaxID=77044 RepID=A0A1S8A9F4_ROSNE|nr:hypothetical protein SAMD00023353_4100350 [Rosellinia necatrix]
MIILSDEQNNNSPDTRPQGPSVLNSDTDEDLPPHLPYPSIPKTKRETLTTKHHPPTTTSAKAAAIKTFILMINAALPAPSTLRHNMTQYPISNGGIYPVSRTMYGAC